MSHASPLVFVVVPTYNEAENLAALVAALMALPLDRLHVLVVDDNSPDGTGGMAEELRAQRYPRLHVLHRPGKQGLGSAYMEGFAFALSHGADFVVQMDADFSHSPKHIPEFIAAMADADVVVGSRYVEGGAVDPAWGWWREGLSRWANSVYTRLILGLDVRDVTSGFKCWSRPALRTILQYPLSSSGYIFQVEMAYVTDRLGFHVQELPIYFEDRRVGRSKLSWSVKIEAMWRTWYLPWRYRYMTRPAPRPSLQARYTRSQGNV